MLEEQIEKIKSGYKASSELLESITEPDREHQDQKILIQRSNAYADNMDAWEGVGYLCGVAYSFVKHPTKTYGVWRKEK